MTRSRARAEPAVSEEEGRAGLVAGQPAADSVAKARWLLQPLGTVSGNDNDFGLLGGYKNESRYGSWPWQVTVRGLRRYLSGTGHFAWQLDAELYPSLGRLGKLLHLEPVITATHAQTTDVGRSDLIAAELDLVRETETMTLSVGGIGYYGWESPRAGKSTDGAIAALVGYWQWGRFELFPEYDFSSDFAGGDGYSVAARCRLTGDSSKVALGLRGGWEKGDTYSLRLELGVPHNKVRVRPRSGL